MIDKEITTFVNLITENLIGIPVWSQSLVINAWRWALLTLLSNHLTETYSNYVAPPKNNLPFNHHHTNPEELFHYAFISFLGFTNSKDITVL